MISECFGFLYLGHLKTSKMNHSKDANNSGVNNLKNALFSEIISRVEEYENINPETNNMVNDSKILQRIIEKDYKGRVDEYVHLRLN